jgi:hypothetical protein
LQGDLNPGQKEDSLAQPFFFLHQAEQQDSTSFAITKETKSSENATGTTNHPMTGVCWNFETV